MRFSVHIPRRKVRPKMLIGSFCLYICFLYCEKCSFACPLWSRWNLCRKPQHQCIRCSRPCSMSQSIHINLTYQVSPASVLFVDEPKSCHQGLGATTRHAQQTEA